MQSPILKRIKNRLRRLWSSPTSFEGSDKYWKSRYKLGGNSGSGSYGHLAEFKAEVLNNFAKKQKVQSVIEFGCGDGNQLALSKYVNYLGIDIAEESIKRCTTLFAGDATKQFKTLKTFTNETAELAISLDVIFHLTEDKIYHEYMTRLFNGGTKYVIVYSSNGDPELAKKKVPHVRHRKFTDWITEHKPEWKLLQHIPNRYPFDGTENTSFADFYIYSK